MAETALVVLFPDLEPVVGNLQRRHTPSGARGLPPHVTLIFPFADSTDVDELLPAVRNELELFAPFTVAFRRVARFAGHLYLAPEPGEPFIAMTHALVRAFPAFPPYGGQFDEVIPHLGVANGDETLLAEVERTLSPPLDITTRVERVWLVEDTPAGWRRHTPFPLDRHGTV